MLAKILKNSRGFTLIEVVSIIVVLGIAIPALANLLSSILVNSDKAAIMSKAVLFAQEKVEEIISDKKSPARGYAWVAVPNRYSGDTPESGYTRSVTVQGAGNVHNGVSYAFVEVKVTHNQISDVKLTTWLTDY